MGIIETHRFPIPEVEFRAPQPSSAASQLASQRRAAVVLKGWYIVPANPPGRAYETNENGGMPETAHHTIPKSLYF